MNQNNTNRYSTIQNKKQEQTIKIISFSQKQLYEEGDSVLEEQTKHLKYYEYEISGQIPFSISLSLHV